MLFVRLRTLNSAGCRSREAAPLPNTSRTFRWPSDSSRSLWSARCKLFRFFTPRGTKLSPPVLLFVIGSCLVASKDATGLCGGTGGRDSFLYLGQSLVFPFGFRLLSFSPPPSIEGSKNKGDGPLRCFTESVSENPPRRGEQKQPSKRSLGKETGRSP